VVVGAARVVVGSSVLLVGALLVAVVSATLVVVAEPESEPPEPESLELVQAPSTATNERVRTIRRAIMPVPDHADPLTGNTLRYSTSR